MIVKSNEDSSKRFLVSGVEFSEQSFKIEVLNPIPAIIEKTDR